MNIKYNQIIEYKIEMLIIIDEKCMQIQTLMFIKGYWLGANREACIWNSI